MMRRFVLSCTVAGLMAGCGASAPAPAPSPAPSVPEPLPPISPVMASLRETRNGAYIIDALERFGNASASTTQPTGDTMARYEGGVLMTGMPTHSGNDTLAGTMDLYMVFRQRGGEYQVLFTDFKDETDYPHFGRLTGSGQLKTDNTFTGSFRGNYGFEATDAETGEQTTTDHLVRGNMVGALLGEELTGLSGAFRLGVWSRGGSRGGTRGQFAADMVER